LLKAALQLGIRLNGNGLGHGGQGARWGADRIGRMGRLPAKKVSDFSNNVAESVKL
jgi:hypothetical protein